ncbi:MAG: coat protein [Sanya benyvirus 1]|nr:MAG: coat protein [Sanya benyvirus 1]
MENLLVEPHNSISKTIPTSSQPKNLPKQETLKEKIRVTTKPDVDASTESIKSLRATSTSIAQNPVQPPPRMAGRYVNYEATQAAFLSYSNWYNVRELTSALRVLQRNDFSVAAQRVAALALLNGINTECPYSSVDRFPVDGHYICEMRAYQQYFLQLRAALNYKDVKDSKHTVAEKHTTAEFNDSMLSYFHAINSILQNIGSRTEVYSRVNFEANFALNWA